MVSGHVQRSGAGREATALLRDGAGIRYVQECRITCPKTYINVTVIDLAGGITRGVRS